MRLRDVYQIVDEYAPFALSREYIERGHHDNSGILLDCGEEIRGVFFSLDLSVKAIEEAKRMGANCIITHHPAIFMPIKCLTDEVGANILACARAGISVISAHLNLDAAPCGIDESLMRGLGGKTPLAVLDRLTGGGYGRVYEVEKRSLDDFVAHIGREFNTERITCYGEGEVKKVASFCGGGFYEGSLAFALANGADTLVSSDGKHHLIVDAVEKGLKVVLLTHYSAENYGFRRFADNITKKLSGIPCAVFTDGRFL